MNIAAAVALLVPVWQLDFFPCHDTATTPTPLERLRSDALPIPFHADPTDAFLCNPTHDGVMVKARVPLASTTTMEPLLPLLALPAAPKNNNNIDQGFTLETWITPAISIPGTSDSTKSRDQPILTIGQREERYVGYHDKATRCPGFDLRLRQTQAWIRLEYTSQNHGCQDVFLQGTRLSLNEDNDPTHIAIQFTQETTLVYINGKKAISYTNRDPQPIDLGLRNWKTSEYGIQIMADYRQPEFEGGSETAAPRFLGSVHSVALFDRVLTQQEIQNLHQFGLRITHIQQDSPDDDTGSLEGESEDSVGESSSDIPGQIPPSPPRLFVPTNLTAISNPNVVLPQGELTSFSIFGSIYGTDIGTVLVEIVSLPTEGTLYGSGVGQQGPLKAGSWIPTTTGDVILRYKPNKDHYFTLPKTTSKGVPFAELKGPDLFRFRLVEMSSSPSSSLSFTDRNTVVTASSQVVVQTIDILNINDPPTLVAPKEATLIGHATASFGVREVYSINGIRLLDDDRNVDQVRVDIVAQSGTLVLGDAEKADLAVWDVCAIRGGFGGWSCKGNGVVPSRKLVFLAEPDDVEAILEGMVYTPYRQDSEDVIAIRVYDGVDGDCLTEEEHMEWGNPILSLHRQRCFATQKFIRVPKPQEAEGVPAAEIAEAEEEGGEEGFWESNEPVAMGLSSYTMLFIAVTASGVLGCCCFTGYPERRICQKKRKERNNRLQEGSQRATQTALDNGAVGTRAASSGAGVATSQGYNRNDCTILCRIDMGMLRELEATKRDEVKDIGEGEAV